MHTYYFEKLQVWQNAKALAVEIYELTEQFPKSEKHSLTDQLRRASLSISANIAEGSTRQHLKEYCRFLNIAFGSAIEVLNHLLIAKDLNYISDEELNSFRNEIGLITNQLRSLNNSIASNNKNLPTYDNIKITNKQNHE